MSGLPNTINDVAELEELMTRPSPALIDDLASVDGDIMLLGVAGKMGPTMARLARRAAPDKNVIGVARFSDRQVKTWLEDNDIETITCDLLDREAVAKLPSAANIVFLAGMKFGASEALAMTWAMNVLVPAIVAEMFARSRIVALSTACVYPYVAVTSGGADETTPAAPPSGDYAMSCLGRERMFEYFSQKRGTSGRLIRLSYAQDLRYGVLADIAGKVKREEPIDVTMAAANVIWQGDANAQVLRALAHAETPASPLNVSGPETVYTRELAYRFGELLGKTPVITGQETETAWLVNTSLAQNLFGQPEIDLDTMIRWVADWVAHDRTSLGKPTHFETRDGKY
jgi:nucleoside-diphosphate-sugar epimerase